MTWQSIDAWWWPYFFMLAAGWFATDIWRALGVYFGGRIDEGSEALVLVRCIATALVAAVVSNLLLFPLGALASVPVAVRVGAVAIGFAAYRIAGKSTFAGIAAAELVLIPVLLLA
ncbi:MAG: AzlD domain-containing protein [Rhizobiaceae bacterium]